MRLVINIHLLFVVFICLIFSCTFSQKRNKPQKNPVDLKLFQTELTQDQQSAFDALNTLQVSTDEMNRLYSTFANLNHSFFPADSSFEVAQSELLKFMEQYISRNCQNLTPEIQSQLAKSAVLAQEEYTVLHCSGNHSTINYENGIPMSGVWVLPNVLGRRDVVLIW